MKCIPNLKVGSRVIFKPLNDWIVIHDEDFCTYVRRTWGKYFTGIKLSRETVYVLLFCTNYLRGYINFKTIWYRVFYNSKELQPIELYGVIDYATEKYPIYLRPQKVPFTHFLIEKENLVHTIKYVHEFQYLIDLNCLQRHRLRDPDLDEET